MSGESGGFRFISHQRSGLIALPGVAASGTLDASAVLSDGSSTPAVTFALPSVGDVLGLDPTLVTRQYPRPGTTDAETEFFPLVEFSIPELSWLLPTPTGAHGPIPWLCLVAVEVRDGVSLVPGGLGTLDRLQIDDPAKPSDELPDPADSVLWAHAFSATQASSADGADPVETGPVAQPAGCRLLAARRLQPQTSYIACLVPTFAAGALAGLGHSDAEVAAALAAAQPNYAWSPNDPSVELPVYLSWEFSCSATGDFESLARALGELPVDANFGTRPLDLGLAGPGMPATTSTTTVLRGALTAPGIAEEPAWPSSGDQDQTAVDAAITAEIEEAAKLTAAAGGAGRPAVGPLLYAGAAAGRSSVGSATPAQGWFDELNRDPRARAVAGIGTRVLRRNVEDIVARAWEQVGDVEAANAVLRRLQASRAVSASLHERHLSALSAGRLVSVARPLLARVTLPATATGGTAAPHALAAVAASALPAGGTWRGIPIALRRASRLGDGGEGSDVPGELVAGLLGGIAEPNVLPDGTVALAPPSKVVGAAGAALLDDRLRADATAAGLAVPPAGADAATVAEGLDSIAASAGHMSSTAAGSLAQMTAVQITQRALPAKVTFSTGLGRALVKQEAQHVEAVGIPAVHTGPQTVGPITAGPVAPGTNVEPPAAPLAHAPAGPIVEPPAAPIAHAPAGPIVGPPAGPIAHPPVGTAPVVVELAGTDPRLAVMRDAFAGAVDRFVRAGTATALPPAIELDLEATRTALLANLHPTVTVATLAAARVPALSGLPRLDRVAPVMAGPVFTDAAYLPLVDASHDAFVPGLDSIPADSVTLVQTNPTFIAAYLAGLNSALGHELLWRGYPTDERGTYWYSFWGVGPEIRALHKFSGSLTDNVAGSAQPLLVLVLRGRLLRRYPDSDIYAVLAGTAEGAPELDDGTNIVRPLFRNFIDPDITLVGFPLTYDALVGTGGGQGYWFVVAEHPGQPRFGLTDPDPAVTHPPLPRWDELSWADLGAADPAPAYLPSAAPAMAPAGTTRTWGASSADMAAITYQPAVRVALRASDLLKAKTA